LNKGSGYSTPPVFSVHAQSEKSKIIASEIVMDDTHQAVINRCDQMLESMSGRCLLFFRVTSGAIDLT
jgi:hypothetical protein